mmetsp:Transcript_3497/g.8702  ORF Transcript_3497/g.8702 Transcript_3497/m.8702 type:complete len:204 (-) Transcript_3497:953-1564(-)
MGKHGCLLPWDVWSSLLLQSTLAGMPKARTTFCPPFVSLLGPRRFASMTLAARKLRLLASSPLVKIQLPQAHSKYPARSRSLRGTRFPATMVTASFQAKHHRQLPLYLHSVRGREAQPLELNSGQLGLVGKRMGPALKSLHEGIASLPGVRWLVQVSQKHPVQAASPLERLCLLVQARHHSKFLSHFARGLRHLQLGGLLHSH